MSADSAGVAEEANRLYWKSDASVAEIATRLDLSRRALYEALTPLPAGEPCDVCGGELAYVNRSAREAGALSCGACGATAELGTDRAAAGSAGPGTTAADARATTRTDRVDDRMALDRGAGALSDDPMVRRAVRLTTAALFGAAVGAAATIALSRDA
jgi:hypothetical protein